MGVRVSIGDFAVMTSLSRKALRHYHDVGILEPTHIDPSTGYRFYDTSQVDHAHIIRRFRSLDMSIPDIKALLSTDDAGARTHIITTHLKQMEAQLQQTRETVGALHELLSPVRTPTDITSRHEPTLAVWSVSATIDTAAIDDWFTASLRQRASRPRLCPAASTSARCSSNSAAAQPCSSKHHHPPIPPRGSTPRSCPVPSSRCSPTRAVTTASTAVTQPWASTSTST